MKVEPSLLLRMDPLPRMFRLHRETHCAALADLRGGSDLARSRLQPLESHGHEEAEAHAEDPEEPENLDMATARTGFSGLASGEPTRSERWLLEETS